MISSDNRWKMLALVFSDAVETRPSTNLPGTDGEAWHAINDNASQLAWHIAYNCTYMRHYQIIISQESASGRMEDLDQMFPHPSVCQNVSNVGQLQPPFLRPQLTPRVFLCTSSQVQPSQEIKWRKLSSRTKHRAQLPNSIIKRK